jgi:hypothetical protein
MTESLSLAASVIALIQLTGKVASLGHEYIQTTERAPEGLLELVGRLESLQKALNTLRAYVEEYPGFTVTMPQRQGDTDGDHPSTTHKQQDPIQECITELENLQAKIEPMVDFDGAVDKLEWTLSEETEQYINRIERLITIAISGDQM